MNKILHIFCSRYRVLLAVAFVSLVGAFAAVAYADHSWGAYHWSRTSNTVTLKLGDNVSNTWDAYLTGASSDWNVSSVLDTTIVAGGTNNTKGRLTPKNCVPTSGRVEVCSAKYGRNGWLGLAQIWASGDHIVAGTAKVNDTYFNTTPYNTPAWRRLVMCQEVAHDFGLAHQDETFNNANLGSCMDYTNDPDGGVGGAVDNDPSNEHPNQHDYDQLKAIYTHLDSGITISQSISGAAHGRNNDDLENSAEWGKAIRASSDGKPSLFERDLGNGNKLFTFVIWAN